MGTDLMSYDRLVDGSLRGVMIEALRLAAQRGLPGGHHFYITLRTDHPGVRLGADLKARHPEELTIVLQHRFRNLEVGDAAFEVSLSFDNAWQTLVVPFEAAARAKRDKERAKRAKARAKRTKRAAKGAAEVIALDAFRKK